MFDDDNNCSSDSACANKIYILGMYVSNNIYLIKLMVIEQQIIDQDM